MTRKECYQKIKELHLEDAIKYAFGDNYTRVKTAVLEAYLNSESPKSPCDCSKEKHTEEPYWGFDRPAPAVNVEKQLQSLAYLLGSLFAILVANKIVDKNEVDNLMKEAHNITK